MIVKNKQTIAHNISVEPPEVVVGHRTRRARTSLAPDIIFQLWLVHGPAEKVIVIRIHTYRHRHTAHVSYTNYYKFHKCQKRNNNHYISAYELIK